MVFPSYHGGIVFSSFFLIRSWRTRNWTMKNGGFHHCQDHGQGCRLGHGSGSPNSSPGSQNRRVCSLQVPGETPRVCCPRRKVVFQATELLSWCVCSSKNSSLSGWWLTYPSEKWWSSSIGRIIPNIWKNKFHVPNHQPDYGRLVDMSIVFYSSWAS